VSDSDGYLIQGGCLCGTVRFELAAAPTSCGYCHCTRCQKRTGTASSINVAVDGRAVRIIAGEDRIGGWQPPDAGMEKCFCSDCGAQLFSRSRTDPSRMGIRMSAFDRDPGVSPSYRQFVAYAAAWEPIPDDDLDRFPESRPSGR
jgi:hypothetical protein